MFEELSEISSNLNKKLPVFTDVICKHGWTLPPEMHISSVNDIDDYNDNIDDLFLRFFEYDGGFYLHQMIERIKNSEIPKPLRKVFKEIYVAYEKELYIVCSISLMAIIEGVALAFYKQGESTQKVKDICNKMVDKYNQDPNNSIQKYAWISYKNFIDHAFKYADFNKPEPELNRNWLLHGKSSYELSKMDCLKLFNSLSTICMIYKHEKEK